MTSVLREWVMALPLREQGALIVATRGCDLAPKFPLDSPERRMTAAIRYAVCVPADVREVDAAPGCFMLSTPPMDVKIAMFEHYPLHWCLHIVHACQIIGYRHPDQTGVGASWRELYTRFVFAMHLHTESPIEMYERLSEDRIAKGTVVQL